MRWFPLVGALIGAGVGLIWWAARWLWPPALAAAVALAADAALTGMLHLDGLLDCADGLLPHLSRSRRLEVMADPRTGAFGWTVGALVLLLRWAALAGLHPNLVLLAGIWCASRTWMAVTIGVLPYARERAGLADAFLGAPPWATGALGLAGACALTTFWNPARGVAVVMAGSAAAAAVVVFARRRLGGFTGDVLGAAGVVGETVALLAAAVRR